MEVVWIFNGAGGQFPSGAFSQRAIAEAWISQNRLTGTLTAYPLDAGIYDIALEKGWFTPKREDQRSPEFIGRYSAANQEHYHYIEGVRA